MPVMGIRLARRRRHDDSRHPRAGHGYPSAYEGLAHGHPELRVQPLPPRKPPNPRRTRQRSSPAKAERATAPRRPAARPSRRLEPDGSGKQPLTLDEALALVIAESEVKVLDETELTDSVAQLIRDGLSPAPEVMTDFTQALEVVARASEGQTEMPEDLFIALFTLIGMERYVGKWAEPDAKWRPGLVEVELPPALALVNKIAGLDPDEPS